MQDKTVKIGLIGLGTVGAGVAKILLRNAELIQRRSGLRLELAHAIDLDPARAEGVELGEGVFHSDVEKLIDDDEVSIAVELIGGIDKACEIIKKLLASGKDVVTANKALLAERGEEIYATARETGRCVAFEASCCGGIPLVGALRTGLAANEITAMYGIVNGTCNFILSSMDRAGKEYEVALAEAQKCGYAEADPILDISGADSAHKLAILSSLAYGKQIDFADISVQGIEEVHLADIRFGREMGYVMKLLAISEMRADGLSLRVHPAFVKSDEPLAQVNGAFNAMSVFGKEVGHTSYYGQGAGEMPTASAVVGDIIEVARGNSMRLFENAPAFGQAASKAVVCKPQEIYSRFYLRLEVVNRPGVLAKITRILGDLKISISACLQHEGHRNDSVPLVIMTEEARQGNVSEALEKIEGLEVVKDKPVCIHVVTTPVD
ncbi:MAG: homoserine dehydrogenase [Planctomycetes bacterium]|nr:homoserine dehydrogenase [Planctomycetota bacterium]